MSKDWNWNINGFVAKEEKQAEDALKVMGLWLAGQSKRLISNITGRLANSISYAVKGGTSLGANDGQGEKASTNELVPRPSEKLMVYVGTSVSYAPYVEFHKNNHSFLRRAEKENRKQLIRLFSREMKK